MKTLLLEVTNKHATMAALSENWAKLGISHVSRNV